MKSLLFSFLILLSIKSYTQNQIELFAIRYEKCFGDNNAFIEDCDTSNLIILFENGFREDYIEVYKNNELFLQDSISTGSILAKSVDLGNKDSIQSFAIRLGNSSIVSLPLFEETPYVRLSYSYHYGSLTICYSRKRPILY